MNWNRIDSIAFWTTHAAWWLFWLYVMYRFGNWDWVGGF